MEGTSTDVPICGHVRAFGSDASRPKRSEGPRLRRARSRLAVVADPHAFVLLSLTVLEVAGGHSGAVDERPLDRSLNPPAAGVRFRQLSARTPQPVGPTRSPLHQTWRSCCPEAWQWPSSGRSQEGRSIADWLPLSTCSPHQRAIPMGAVSSSLNTSVHRQLSHPRTARR